MAFHINPAEPPEGPTEPPVGPPESPVAATFAGPYENGYRTARLLISSGKVFMYWLSWIYGLFHVLIALPLGGPSVFYSRSGPGGLFRIFVMQAVPWLYSVAYTWAIGLILVGVGHTLTAVLDTTTGSSPAPPPTYASPV